VKKKKTGEKKSVQRIGKKKNRRGGRKKRGGNHTITCDQIGGRHHDTGGDNSKSLQTESGKTSAAHSSRKRVPRSPETRCESKEQLFGKEKKRGGGPCLGEVVGPNGSGIPEKKKESGNGGHWLGISSNASIFRLKPLERGCERIVDLRTASPKPNQQRGSPGAAKGPARAYPEKKKKRGRGGPKSTYDQQLPKTNRSPNY